MRTDVGLAVYNILNNASTVTAILGTGTSCKLYPVQAPQTTQPPFVVYSIVSVAPTDTKDRPTSLDTVRLQVDCYETTYAKAETLNSAVRVALDAKAHSTYGGTKLDGIKFENESDMMEEELDLYRKSTDYFIRVKY